MKSTERFSDRVGNYLQYRPSYPSALIASLLQQVPRHKALCCADIGSGTGIFTSLLLPHFAKVYGVEPNAAMRAAAGQQLRAHHNHVSLDGSAERTGLADHSVDLVVAAQAFHWFDIPAFRSECQRILRQAGIAALVWNLLQENTPFLREYHALLKEYGGEYKDIRNRNISQQEFHAFFGQPYQKSCFPNFQSFDLVGLYGRLDSLSYAPKEGTEEFTILRRELKRAFQQHAVNGQIIFNYETEMSFATIV